MMADILRYPVIRYHIQSLKIESNHLEMLMNFMNLQQVLNLYVPITHYFHDLEQLRNSPPIGSKNTSMECLCTCSFEFAPKNITIIKNWYLSRTSVVIPSLQYKNATFRHIIPLLVSLTLNLVSAVYVNLNKNRMILIFEFG